VQEKNSLSNILSPCTTGLVITGYPKAGKTTFSKRLSKRYNLSHISLDALIDSFETIYPELNINHDINTLAEITSSVRSFAYHLISRQMHYEIPFILEGYHIDTLHIEPFLKKLNIKIISLGYPSISPEEKLSATRNNSQAPDWTLGQSDEWVLNFFSRTIKASKNLKNVCKENSLPFFDSGKDFEECYKEICHYLDSFKCFSSRL
jgi:hypothetical protein